MKYLNLFFISLVMFSCNNVTDQALTKTGKDGDYEYQYVEGDPMQTRVYTLDNGLKVYLSDYKNEPRTHVYIPVRAGGKNDPADNTGLAHYLEHIMFKGNDQFGTINYKEEKVLLDSIEWMFNEYAKLTDSVERREWYAKIDEISGRAAQWAIPNEYDKLIAGLGGKSLNAYTFYDQTVYTVDIPSNELSKFLEIEGSRFKKIVNRLFHTELEAVYEEKNRGLDSDGRKTFESMMKLLFNDHPYGTQTVIGTIDHLKNPSITEINKYFEKYYAPNNVAICISGDIDFHNTISTIDKYFGDWKPNNNLEKLPNIEEAPIESPRTKEVYGPDAENLMMGFRVPGIKDSAYIKLQLMDMILSNSEAGLIDLNLSQTQKVLRAGCSPLGLADYSVHYFYGYAKDGQTLEDVKELILNEIEKVKTGDFEDWLIPAIINDFKKSEMQQLQYNRARADQMVTAFINELDWEDHATRIKRMEQLTKQDIVDFANQYYGDNYAIVYKRTGEDPNKRRVEKPQITKVPLNRDTASVFHRAILDKESPKINPVFVNYEHDIERTTLNNGVEVLSNKNTENGLFQMNYLLDIGSNNDPEYKIAVQLLEYLGTDEMTAEEFKKELYKIGCSFSVFASDERTYVSLNGLDENLEEGMKLFENLLLNVVPNQEELEKLVDRLLKSRDDSRKNKGTILYSGLMSYAQYGAKNPFNNVLSNAEMLRLSADSLVLKLKELMNMEHRVLYYGPRNLEEFTSLLEKYHVNSNDLLPIPELVTFDQLNTDNENVYWTNYDMVQTEFMLLHKGSQYDKDVIPQSRMFNEYFGGGMNSIVFQEIREAQGLAYSAFSRYNNASKPNESDVMFAYIGTQADKQSEAMAAIRDLIENLPKSEKAFEVSKQGILNKIETERITRSGILWNYESAKQRGLDYDIRKDVYEQVQNMTFEDVEKFHKEYIKGKGFVTVLMGDKSKIDFEDLQNYGEVRELTLDEIFGYEENKKINVELQN